MINKKEFFGIEESMMYPGKYVLSINDYEGFMLKGTVGSYNVIFSRILNMSYPTFLRFCRDMCGAELIGKNSLYVTAFTLPIIMNFLSVRFPQYL